MAFDTVAAVGLRDIGLYSITDLTTPTYAAKVDLPAASQMEVSATFTELIAEGDDQIVSAFSLPNGAEWTMEQATNLDMSAIEVLLGGTASDSDSGTDETTYWYLTTTQEVPFFGFIGQAIDAESDGDVHVQVFKARVNSGPGGAFAYGAYKSVTWGGRCLPSPYGDNRIFGIHNHATAVAPNNTWPGNEPYKT